MVVLLAVVAAVVTYSTGQRQKHLSAEFANTISLYAGAPVEILGVRVGSVNSVEVRGIAVHVEMSYDASRSIPADAQAVIVPPSLAGDRFVQLTPPYTGGPMLPDGAHLDISRTQVPMELDQALQNVNDLAKGLGPNGSNGQGALSRLLTESAANLRGNGDAIRRTIQELSGALGTLSSSRQDIAGTVRNLGVLTSTLARDDGQVRDLVDNLASVSNELNGQRDELGHAVRNLNQALGDVAGLVRDNRHALTDNIGNLTRLTGTLAEHQRDLAELLDLSPLAYSNSFQSILPLNYDPIHPDAVVPAARTALSVARSGGIPTTAPTSADLDTMVGRLCSGPPGSQSSAACAKLRGLGTNDMALLNLLGPSVLGALGTPPAANTSQSPTPSPTSAHQGPLAGIGSPR